jgi:hypothetical protein
MKLAEWLAEVPETSANAGPGKALSDNEPGSRARPLQ